MGPKTHDLVRAVLLRSFMLIDVALLSVAFVLAAILTSGLDPWTAMADLAALKVNLYISALIAIGLLVSHGILVSCKLYESKRFSSRDDELRDVVRAMLLLTACIWAEAKLFRAPHLPTYFWIAFWTTGSLLLMMNRLSIRAVLRVVRRRGRNLHHVLVLGTNWRAVDFARMMETMPERGCRVLGFVDDEWSGSGQFRESGYSLACNFAELPDFLRKNVVDEIAIYLPLRSFYERSAEIARLAKQHGIIVRINTDVFNVKFSLQHAETTRGFPQIVATSHHIDGWQFVTKRAFDFCASLALLILLSPLFALVTVLIKLTSSGPVFFAQQRVGLNKRRFTMFKFRTMVVDADRMQDKVEHLNEMSGPVFKIKNDPRITPIGRILRKASIDELPQLLNVLKGDMSLVGPRAIPVRDYQSFSEDWHRRRFSVSPGITCLWQVYGRNTIPFDQWMALDMQYIDSWSFWLDLKILALTIPAVFRGSGAT